MRVDRGNRFSSTHRGAMVLGVLVLGASVLSSCAEEGATAGGGGEGVEAGATREQYIEAFEEVDPVSVQLQSDAAPGTPNAESIQAYVDALSDWSGGKLEIEIAHNGSIAPLPEAGAALADGRIDTGTHVPLYEPSEYPIYNQLIELTFAGDPTPQLGRMTRVAAYLETAWGSDEVIDELTAAGIQPLLPLFRTSPMQMLLCTDEAATTSEDMDGLTARGGGPAHLAQMEAMGITPVTLDITEIFEGLQRGVADCGAMNLTTATLVGVLDVAPHASFSPEVGFVEGPGAWGAGLQFWESLPLVAQQLMWDRLDVLIEEDIKAGLTYESQAIETIQENGGEVVEWDDEVEEALNEHNQSAMESIRDEHPELVDDLVANLDKWESIVAELGYEDAGPAAELPEWYAADDLDLDPYIDRVVEDILTPLRP